MKIAIFSDNFYPELSGISDSVISLAVELARRGHYIRFYVPAYAKRNYRKAGAVPKELALGTQISFKRCFSFPYPTGTGQARFVIPNLLHIFDLKKFGPDVIHTQQFFGLGMEALFFAKLLKRPLIGTNHTAVTEFFRYLPITAQWFKQAILNYVIWYYNRCGLVTAPSQFVFDEMKRQGFKNNHRVISNPIDTVNFAPVRSEDKPALKKLFKLSNKTTVYAGRLAYEKNIPVIFQALSLIKQKIPDIMLALAGHGNRERDLRQLARTLNITDNVSFLGTVDKATLAKLYNASEAFVIASTSETQSMTLMQAMACGLPAVGVRARALPEYIQDGKNGFLTEPGDYAALAEKIIYLMESPALREKLGAEARISAEKFSAKIIAGEWEQIYEQARITNLKPI